MNNSNGNRTRVVSLKKSQEAESAKTSRAMDSSSAKETKNDRAFEKIEGAHLEIEVRSKELKSSRRELYNELERKSKDELPDIFIFPPLILRAMASAIDGAIIFGGALLSLKLTPVLVKTIESWGAVVKLKELGHVYHFNRPVMLSVFGLFILIFCILPLVDKNATIGKRIFRLNVRSNELYEISFFQAIFREIIVKPISLISVIGWLLPFFNKRKKALHDFICRTVVVK